MQRVADWLEKLGMSEYAERFAESDIDSSVLRDLTDQDLKELGVSLGHRRKMLRAIAKLDAAPPAPTSAALATRAPILEAAGERRHVTVMFCDLVGSTGISAKLDAEEWRDLVGAYLDAGSAAVTEMGGHVAKKLGDGLMAMFGYPVAYENGSERAVRASLAIQRALAELNRKNAGAGKPELKARIGLETGPAVVDAAGEIYGDVANVAARVQALGEPGTVLVTANVQRQVAGLFVAEERGSHELKGVPEAVTLFRIVRASGGGRRAGQRRLTPLVGREEEVAMLMRRWERARQGDGQLVLIVGEPGLGKSRLIEEFHGRLLDIPHTWTEWSCSQLLQNTPLHPLAEWGRIRFGGADRPGEQRLAELESVLAQVKLDAVENAALLAPLLDVPVPANRVLALPPEEMRRRQLGALTALAIASAKVQPLVLVFEDLHWADPTTLDLLRGIAEQGAAVPLYVLATARPEFRPPWSMRSHHATISLAPLDRQQVRDMVVELSARHALPKEVIDGVTERTGGVPLFVEEVTRLLLERGEQGGIQAIPPTLQQSLTARLDRLGPAREVAQVGAVIGRGFSYALLAAVAGMEEGPLQTALERLADADILLVQRLPPASDYRFKHALIQDAAYENLLKSRRQVLHRGIAEALRDRFAETAEAEPEVLAYHFTQAGLTDEAIEWWGKAGDHALRRSAFQEAISHLGKAIEMADKVDGGKPRKAVTATSTSHRLKLQTSYGLALAWSRGFAAEETKAAFTHAGVLSVGEDVSVERFVTLYGRWIGSIVGGPLTVARELAENFLREAEDSHRATETAVGFRCMGQTCFYEGELTKAQEYLVQALMIYNPERDHEASIRYGPDAAAAAQMYLAHIKWHLGEFAQARKLIEEAIAHATQTGHIASIASAYSFKAILEWLCGDAAATLRTAETVVDLCQRHGLALFLASGRFFAGWARAKLDQETGIAEARQALAAIIELGAKAVMLGAQGALAEIEAKTGDVEGALARIEKNLALAAKTGTHIYDAFLHRVRGDILLKRDPASTVRAEQAFLTAIDIAKQQKSRSYELQAALALAKLYQSTGRPGDAHAVLAPGLEGFTPAPELPEIAEAQQLLNALSETDEVKTAAASRQRRLKLQTNYGLAVAWSRGFAAEETKAAFTRARELSAGTDISDERFVTLYGQWVGSFTGGVLTVMRELAETFLREAENTGRATETAVGIRYLGTTCLFQGELAKAQAYLEQALKVHNSERDRQASTRYGTDAGAAARIYLALVKWYLGEFAQARELSEEAVVHATRSDHIPTITTVYLFKAWLEQLCDDAAATLRTAETQIDLCQRHGILLYLAYGKLYSGWARAKLGDRESGVAEVREALTALIEQGAKVALPSFQCMLAEIEAEAGDAERAFARIDEALALAGETGAHLYDPFLHRVRGDILLKRDPANTAPAEQAFLTALDIARQQKSRSYELRAALALAKLYQSTRRPADAHAALAPALEGFTPAPELQEIAEAQTLLAALQS